jgi:hypothetical protein|tara:strand:- start:44 stop:523 length:480 start_codon:yes stop_codon:yes gene_type:complete
MAANTTATFSHAAPGCMTSSHRIVIKNACVQNTETEFSFDQPKDSVIDAVFVHMVDGVSIGGAADIGFNLGTNSNFDGTDLVNDDNGILDQSASASVAAGTIIKFTPEQGGGPVAGGLGTASSGSFTGVSRKIFGQISTGNQTITNGNEVEIHVVYRHF